jgi:hypothetical protein
VAPTDSLDRDPSAEERASFPPGGPLDTVGRITAESMRVTLGQPIIITSFHVFGDRRPIDVEPQSRTNSAAAPALDLLVNGAGTVQADTTG